MLVRIKISRPVWCFAAGGMAYGVAFVGANVFSSNERGIHVPLTREILAILSATLGLLALLTVIGSFLWILASSFVRLYAKSDSTQPCSPSPQPNRWRPFLDWTLLINLNSFMMFPNLVAFSISIESCVIAIIPVIWG